MSRRGVGIAAGVLEDELDLLLDGLLGVLQDQALAHQKHIRISSLALDYFVKCTVMLAGLRL
jgi:hypothetical protein